MGKIRQAISTAMSAAARKKARDENFEKASQALNELSNLAQGLPPSIRSYLSPPPYEPLAGGDAAAIQSYALLICHHVENLNSLVKTHRAHILPLSQMRCNWPILISPHPHFTQDAKWILTNLRIGKHPRRHCAAYCRWKSEGKIATLVDDFLWWADECERIHSLSRNNFPWYSDLYAGSRPNSVIAELRKHLEMREHAAAKLPSLNQTSVPHWEDFIRALMLDCFLDKHCADILTRFFVNAESKSKSPGRAKEYLTRKICERLRTLVGDKAEAK